jgi:hypothetical protein
VAGGEIVVWKKTGTEKQLNGLLGYIARDSLVHLMELFHGCIVMCLFDGHGWLWTLVGTKFICCTHSVWVVHSMTDMTSPFIFRAVLKVDGNMSWRNSGGGATGLD